MHVSKGGYIVPEVLLKIGQILSSVHDIKRYAGESDENHENYPMIMAMMDSLVEEPDLVATINNAIISEDEISDNASRNLARIRQTKRQKTENIRDKINSILSSNDQALQENIVTMRDDRYVIPVKVSHKSSFKGIVHDHSSSGQTVYIEPMEVVELNNELRMLEAEEREEIIRILKEISDRVYDAKDSIFVDQDVLSRLDFIFAKAKYAIEIDATNPKLNTNGYFNFKNARHPLLDKKKVVPISIYLGDDYNTLVITGPNTGGKTVTLKTVGLITLMAQSGILIPVDENSEVAIFDNIFTDIGDEQSIEQSLSTFSAHMKNIVHIVNNITFNSLVLFDELGAGTDPTEGAALAIAILRIFLDKSIRTIATTHYSQLKIFALTEKYVKNGSVEFDVNTLSPTYKLRIGIPGKSNAFEISRRLGLDDDIINNAKEILSQEDKDFEDVLSDIESEKKQIDEDKRRQLELKEDLLKLRDRYEKELEKTRLEKERIINEAKENA
ncbi:MAG: endonuclease MutS2, partial [Finegoldia magna]|nr:endonuclease MutS2 [Finegoldia magna]